MQRKSPCAETASARRGELNSQNYPLFFPSLPLPHLPYHPSVFRGESRTVCWSTRSPWTNKKGRSTLRRRPALSSLVASSLSSRAPLPRHGTALGRATAPGLCCHCPFTSPCSQVEHTMVASSFSFVRRGSWVGAWYGAKRSENDSSPVVSNAAFTLALTHSKTRCWYSSLLGVSARLRGVRGRRRSWGRGLEAI